MRTLPKEKKYAESEDESEEESEEETEVPPQKFPKKKKIIKGYVEIPTFQLKRIWFAKRSRKVWCSEEGHWWYLAVDAEHPKWVPWHPKAMKK